MRLAHGHQPSSPDGSLRHVPFRTDPNFGFEVPLAVELRQRQYQSSELLIGVIALVIIGAVVFLGYKLQVISLAATIAGLCSFVPALFVEAGRQFYFAIIRREESF